MEKLETSLEQEVMEQRPSLSQQLPQHPEEEKNTLEMERKRMYERDSKALHEIRERLSLPSQPIQKTEIEPLKKVLFGDFQDAKVNHNGRIVLSESDMTSIMLEIKKIKKKCRFSMPALFQGNKTATEYDSKASNFSTTTNIVTLEDGRKVFMVYNYPTSWVHRSLDGVSKQIGCRK